MIACVEYRALAVQFFMTAAKRSTSAARALVFEYHWRLDRQRTVRPNLGANPWVLKSTASS